MLHSSKTTKFLNTQEPIIQQNIWRDSLPKNEKKNNNSVIIYSSSCRSKPVWLSFYKSRYFEICLSVFFVHTLSVGSFETCFSVLRRRKEKNSILFIKWSHFFTFEYFSTLIKINRMCKTDEMWGWQVETVLNRPAFTSWASWLHIPQT